MRSGGPQRWAIMSRGAMYRPSGPEKRVIRFAHPQPDGWGYFLSALRASDSWRAQPALRRNAMPIITVKLQTAVRRTFRVEQVAGMFDVGLPANGRRVSSSKFQVSSSA